MKTINMDIALTVAITIPSNIATEYRRLGFITGNKDLVKLSNAIHDDDEFIHRIISDNIRSVLGGTLPKVLESGGFGVKIIPLALQRANEKEETPSTEEVAAAIVAELDSTEA